MSVPSVLTYSNTFGSDSTLAVYAPIPFSPLSILISSNPIVTITVSPLFASVLAVAIVVL